MAGHCRFATAFDGQLAGRCISRTFRTWAPAEEPQVTGGEIWDRQRDLVALLLDYVSLSGTRWSDLIEALGNVPKEAHDAIVSNLAALDLRTMTDGARAQIWNSLRAFVAQHRRFSQAEWVLPEPYLRRVEEVGERFEPADPIVRTAWLFSYHAHIAGDVGDDFSAEDAALREARLQAVTVVHGSQGVTGIVNMIDVVDEPLMLGESFGRSAVGEECDEQLLRAHLAGPGRTGQFARAFVVGRATTRGNTWIRRALRLPALGVEQRAELLVCLPDRDEAWKMMERDSAVQTAYWKAVYPFDADSVEQVEYAARKLIAHGRATRAVELLWHHIRDTNPPSSILITCVLEAFIHEPGEQTLTRSIAYYLGELLDAVAEAVDVDQGRLVQVEWALAKFLDSHRPPVLLHRELVQKPAFYVELLSCVFKEEEGEPSGEVSDADARRAQTADAVLRSWRTPPGVSSDGSTMDADVLGAWIRQALDLANAVRRRAVAEEYIGRVLRYVPTGGDGIWPHEVVRELLEQLENSRIERGLEVEIYNSRGVVHRDPAGGGGQERRLAAQYSGWAAAVDRRWARTVELLRLVAETYEREAQAEDSEAELRKDGFW